MKIAFDSQIFTMQEYGGISRYISSLAAQVAYVEGVDAKIFAPFYINAYLEKLPKGIVSGMKVPKIPKTGRVFYQASLWLAREAIAKFEPQIVHETYYSARPMAPKGASKVVTVYDMIHERFPSIFSQQDQTSKLKRESVLRADHVICISENTRRDLLELVPVSPEKVSVVYLGFDQFSSVDKEINSKSSVTELPYLLFVGGRGHYKNFNGLLKAYASSSWLRQNFRIICVGGGKLQVDELELMHKLGVSNQQVEQINANDDLLAEFYRGAAAFIYPSKYEGFGIPPLEAMSMECPVICSNTSSIPEVVGDAGEYFDPDSTDSIRIAIECVLQNEERKKLLVQKGMERCGFFSWKRCASETLAIYQGII
ncbi:MAG TPA: glycosyltransferase family 1 protein [Methylotenera sp.]|nr:glycosyltransferase family 1 protein [Methylotenera sp.]